MNRNLSSLLRVVVALIAFVSMQSVFSEEEKPLPEYAYVTAKRGLVLREKPDPSSKKLAIVPYGTRVNVMEYSVDESTISGRTERWVRTEFNGIIGWVFNAYLKEIQNTESYQRIPDAKIHTFLKAYNYGKPLASRRIGFAECPGVPIIETDYRGGVKVIGTQAHPFDYTFNGPFKNILGIATGMPGEQVVRILGNPVSASANELRFISEKPEGYESEYFDARWEIRIRLGASGVQQIRFIESYDDC